MQKKHDIFDWLGDMMRIPVAIVSGTFTGKLLAKTLGFNGFDAIMIVIDFNSTMVRLKLFVQSEHTRMDYNFNSTMVRLKPFWR